jgi:hypothetical protein
METCALIVAILYLLVHGGSHSSRAGEQRPDH